jgi:hypothetical protein
MSQEQEEPQGSAPAPLWPRLGAGILSLLSVQVNGLLFYLFSVCLGRILLRFHITVSYGLM